MAPVYFVDGYNVIHHSTRLRPLAIESFEQARDALIEHVGRFCVATGQTVKIIFDGRGRRAEPASPLKGIKGLEVLYSPGHQSADALIERTVYQTPNRRNVIVVSSDRGIRDLCRGLGAMVMDADIFLDTIGESESETRAAMVHLQRADTLNRIENRLGEANVSLLEQLKRKLKT
ncbi:MAG TPA: NYN domain-containing protein [Candidatus Hydrogenedentes bacterium]|nr:NYN domain-containing protein [Candidatus Hydrogenedentota bacterium]